LAKRLGVFVAYGAIEKHLDSLYNAMIVLDTTGTIVAHHRKVLLHWIDSANGVVKADLNTQVFEIDGVRFGLSICADANSAELHAAYRTRGIDALLYSVTSAVPVTAKWLRYWPYARRYDAWIVAANRSGIEGDESYPGTVFVAAPNGRVQTIANVDDGYVTAVVSR
jgi:predicted amidohydrolase